MSTFFIPYHIDWIRTKAGRNMPVNPEPVLVVEGGGNEHFVTDEGEVITGRIARPENEGKRKSA